MISKLPDIPSAQKKSLHKLTEFQDVIDDGNNMGRTQITKHQINTGDGKPNSATMTSAMLPPSRGCQNND